jgi:hypothetical protein
MASFEEMYSNLEAEHLIRETEREILNDAMDLDHPADSPFSDDIVADQSRVEGWNGHLDNSELIHTTAYGHEQHGFDRPLAFREEQDAVTENARLQQELSARDQQIQQLLDQAGPIREAREQQQQQRREQLMDAALDPQRADQVLNTLEGQQQQLYANNMDRCNAALEAAHGKYGRDFERVYSQVQNMDPRNPLTNQIVQSLFASRDPGEALMSLADNPLLETLSSGRPVPPFMPQPARAAPAAEFTGRRIEEDDLGYDFDHGGAGEEMETDIFRHAARR